MTKKSGLLPLLLCAASLGGTPRPEGFSRRRPRPEPTPPAPTKTGAHDISEEAETLLRDLAVGRSTWGGPPIARGELVDAGLVAIVVSRRGKDTRARLVPTTRGLRLVDELRLLD